MNWKHIRALQKIKSLNPTLMKLEDAQRLASVALEHAPELRIVCAANKYGDVIVCGARHYDMVMHSVLPKILGSDKRGEVQGFIDNKGKFHDRRSALIIAKAAGQIYKDKCYPLDQLFSEDLY